MGILAKAACDTAVSSACAAGGVPTAVCDCFKKDLSNKCQSYISRRQLGKKSKKGKKLGKKSKKSKKEGKKDKKSKKRMLGKKSKKSKKEGKKSKKSKKERRLGAGKAALKTVAKKCMD